MEHLYFLSDAHLGSLALDNNREREQSLVRFLDSIKTHATALYLLGDMFDFWYEWHSVVPRGYTRFLGKLSELVDSGIEVHYFTGNHDVWCYSYLEQECGVIMHREPYRFECGGKHFFLAHGDGLGDPDPMFRFLRAVFHNRFLQICFSSLPPRFSLWLGRSWAASSMIKHRQTEEYSYLGKDKEHLICYSATRHAQYPDTDYYVYGHRHILVSEQIEGGKSAQVYIIGDWIKYFSYAEFTPDQGMQLKRQ